MPQLVYCRYGHEHLRSIWYHPLKNARKCIQYRRCFTWGYVIFLSHFLCYRICHNYSNCVVGSGNIDKSYQKSHTEQSTSFAPERPVNTRKQGIKPTIFTDQRTEKAGESEKQLPGFVVLGFSPDLTPAEYEKILSAAESRHDRTHRKSRLLGNDFPDFDPSIRAVGALYIQGNGPFAGLRIAVNGAGFVGSGPVAEIPAPLLDLSS